jgi:hypothetical protein
VAAGGLIVREAEFPSGRRMTREANAGGRKGSGKPGAGCWRLRQRLADNWPDTGACPARKGADAGQVGL